jgi:hypothetical protein
MRWFFIYTFIFFNSISNKVNKNNNNSFWQNVENFKGSNDELDNIVYKLFQIHKDINTIENLNHIFSLKYVLPINVFFLRKSLEERILLIKNEDNKKFYLQEILKKYLKYKNVYFPISRDFKISIILSFLTKKYMPHVFLYEFTNEILHNLAYETEHLSFNILKQIYNIYNIDIEKRFIFLVEKHNIQEIKNIVNLNLENKFLKKNYERFLYINKNKKVKVFLNIYEFHWFLNEFKYTDSNINELANICIENMDIILDKEEKNKRIQSNILHKIINILPTLIINNYLNIEELLNIKTDIQHEKSHHILDYARGLYMFFKKDYKKASTYFSKALVNNTTLKEQAKYQFWLANSFMKLKKDKEALYLYKEVAKLNIPYYSTISYMFLQKEPIIKSIQDLKEEAAAGFYDWYFRALQILTSHNEFLLSLSFIININADSLRVISKEMLKTIHMLKKLKNQCYIVLVLEKIYEFGGIIFKENFPIIEIIENYPLKIKLLLSSILKRETFFRLTCELKSNKGASGIMQVMPNTAKTICERNNMKFCSKNLLNNHDYNIQIAIKCLQELLNIFKNSLFLVIPAYNIGSPAVLKWWKFFQNTLDKNNIIDMLLFVELIPVTVTKNYTKDVINNFILYSTIHYHHSISINFLLDFNIDP